MFTLPLPCLPEVGFSVPKKSPHDVRWQYVSYTEIRKSTICYGGGGVIMPKLNNDYANVSRKKPIKNFKHFILLKFLFVTLIPKYNYKIDRITYCLYPRESPAVERVRGPWMPRVVPVLAPFRQWFRVFPTKCSKLYPSPQIYLDEGLCRF